MRSASVSKTIGVGFRFHRPFAGLGSAFLKKLAQFLLAKQR
jgi:hypothetical protein